MSIRPQPELAGIEVPSLPGLVGRLVATFADDDVQVMELARLLEGDPGIVSRLLRLANSPYYGFPREVKTVERAIWLLGRTTVAAVALGAVIFRHGRGVLPPEARKLWTDAYRSALGCRYLAKRLPVSPWRSPPDVLFVAGLLHDIGMLLFLAAEPELYLDIVGSAETTSELLRQESNVLGQDHASFSGDALEAWNFPIELVAVCRHHHGEPLRAELLPDWEVVSAVDALISAESPRPTFSTISDDLLDDVAEYLERARPEAEAFFRAVR